MFSTVVTNTPEQDAAMVEAIMGGQNICLTARAGTGKTYTIGKMMQAVNQRYPGVFIKALAFNTTIAAALKEKIKDLGLNHNVVTSRTMAGYSRDIITAALGVDRAPLDLEGKTRKTTLAAQAVVPAYAVERGQHGFKWASKEPCRVYRVALARCISMSMTAGVGVEKMFGDAHKIETWAKLLGFTVEDGRPNPACSEVLLRMALTVHKQAFYKDADGLVLDAKEQRNHVKIIRAYCADQRNIYEKDLMIMAHYPGGQDAWITGSYVSRTPYHYATRNVCVDLMMVFTEIMRDSTMFCLEELPIRCINYGLKDNQSNCVFIDESQDLSKLDQVFLKSVLRDQCRKVFVMDDKQALYAFRGADSDACLNIKKDFDATILPLTTTFRCSHAVVKFANSYVPDLVAAPANKPGIVAFMEELPIAELGYGDAVLCRTNRPLVKVQMDLYKLGKKSRSRSNLYPKIKAFVSASVFGNIAFMSDIEKIEKWQKFLKDIRGKSDEIDTADAVGVAVTDPDLDSMDMSDPMVSVVNDIIEEWGLAEGEMRIDGFDSLDFVTKRIFDSEGTESWQCVDLCTYHMSKGLEWNRVFLLEHLALCPSPFAVGAAAIEQEDNAAYVAITRSKNELYFVGYRPAGMSAKDGARMPIESLKRLAASRVAAEGGFAAVERRGAYRNSVYELLVAAGLTEDELLRLETKQDAVKPVVSGMRDRFFKQARGYSLAGGIGR